MCNNEYKCIDCAYLEIVDVEFCDDEDDGIMIESMCPEMEPGEYCKKDFTPCERFKHYKEEL